MKGLIKGEASDATNPVLQLYCRQGQFMADPVEGSFVIEDVSDPNALPIERVSTTSLDLNPIDDPSPGHRLGPGRFYVPTGDTSAWVYGTHRVVYAYKMAAGGRQFQQVIEFEVLNPAVFPSGQSYVGYASTARLYTDGLFLSTNYPPQALHTHIRRVSLELENLLERFFEPRYLDLRVDGDGRPVLFLNEAIVAIEGASLISVQSDGSETFSAYDTSGFRVYNRHEDGLLSPDDRGNPKLEVGRDDISGYQVRGWRWPQGDRNLSVKGVFGFLDPDPRPDGVLIGSTPDDLVQVVGALIGRYLEDPSLSAPGVWQPGMVKLYKTRDQQLQFYAASGNVDYSGGITGDPLLDQKLLRFVKPARLNYIGRDEAGLA